MPLPLSLLLTTSLPTTPASSPSPWARDPEGGAFTPSCPGCCLHGTKHVFIFSDEPGSTGQDWTHCLLKLVERLSPGAIYGLLPDERETHQMNTLELIRESITSSARGHFLAINQVMMCPGTHEHAPAPQLPPEMNSASLFSTPAEHLILSEFQCGCRIILFFSVKLIWNKGWHFSWIIWDVGYLLKQKGLVDLSW